ncbi:MAG: acyl-CoA dehydrogenase family protein [Propionibacteriaceae bacterium]|jgi:alkylation response protein AidB-like acyl-CoA dehydrogenase|nr:acyl-CoA dehydrogenase family protein [Propionibacteriaceae bacterium]
MSFELTDEQALTREAVRQFADTAVAPLAAEIDRDHRAPLENLPAMAELGLFGMIVPEDLGGSGAGSLSYIIAVEELARRCATHAVIVEAHSSLCCWPILTYGSPQQRQAYLPDLAAGAKIGAFALTEPAAGTDAASLTTSAKREGDQWVLNGQKVFITNGGFADVFVVLARTDPEAPSAKGISAFIVEGQSAGLTVGDPERKLGIRGSSTTPLIFSDLRLPSDALLGQEGQGFGIAMSTLDGGRTGIAAQALGIAQGAYEAAVAYAQERVQFGKPIARLQAIQWMIADMATDLEAGRLLCYQAADREERGLDFAVQASMAKLFCAQMAVRVASTAIQVLGGIGYTESYPVERAYRDAKITEIYEGTNEVQRLVIAKSQLR